MTDLIQNMDFKNYKEKQRFYEARSKQETMFWISSGPINPEQKHKGIKKGLTYIKPKGGDK